MPNVTINNFPPNGSTGEMHTLMFGPTGPMRVLIDIDSEDGEDFDIDLTVSNAAGHGELKAFLVDLIELLQLVVETDIDSAVGKALEEKRASYAEDEDEYLDEDDFFDEDDD